MALMVGAMTIHGIVPGPQVMQKQPELVWGMIASMWIGNLMLGPLMEENLRRALLISRGDWTVFLTRPLSAVLMAMAAFLLVLAVLPSLR
jgi:TctA family transporter